MTANLIVTRKADRTKMAAKIVALCEELGASCSIRDNATHVWPDGSRPCRTRSLTLEIASGDAQVRVDLDADSDQQKGGVWVLAWVTDVDTDTRFDWRFGFHAGGNANGRKCTAVAEGGFEGLLASLRSALECIKDGAAFEVVEAEEPATIHQPSPSTKPAMTYLSAKALYVAGEHDKAWKVAQLDEGLSPAATREAWEAFMVQALARERDGSLHA